MIITYNDNRQDIRQYFDCPKQNNDIIIDCKIEIAQIRQQDIKKRGLFSSEYITHSFGFDFDNLSYDTAPGLNVTNVISLDNIMLPKGVGLLAQNENKIEFTLNDNVDRDITFHIKVKVNITNIDPQQINNISFRLTISDTNGKHPINVSLTKGYNCNHCRDYYSNLFNINTQDILFTQGGRYDIATINTNQQVNNNNVRFPVKAVDDIPQKEISIDGINFEPINALPYTYNSYIRNGNNLNLTFRIGRFLCFNDGSIRVNRTINVLNAINDLAVTINNNAKTFIPDTNGYINLGNLIMPSVGMTQDYTIVLSNTAQGTPNNFANHAYGLRINSVNVTNNTNQDELGRIEGWTNNSNDIKNDFLIGINNPPQNNIFIAPMATNEYFVIRLDRNHLGNIKVENNINYIDLRLELTINYIVVNDNIVRTKNVTYNIIGRLFRELPSVHHSIDFGTSAIVACKRESNGNINIIDLKTTKNNLFNDIMETKKRVPKQDQDGNTTYDEQGNITYKECNIITEDKINDNSEPDANLISSSMAVRDDDFIDTNSVIGYGNHTRHIDYYNEHFWFSPTSALTHINNHLPCLKNLVGQSTIRLNDNQIDVSNVITDAYKQLCKYFLSNEQIESLALTIPNSFNNVHKQQLERIIYDNIKTIAKPYEINDKEYSCLSFISESDSVLYSYIYNKIRDNAAVEGDEYVFVYDMGAGTLDISYAKCSYNLNDNNQVVCNSVEILGRSGINKAGNYIDYLLGEIILDKLSDQDQKTQFKNTLTNNTVDPRLRKNLKSYLRNSVKTSLNNDPQSRIPYQYYNDNNEQEPLTLEGVEIADINNITIADIITHRSFTNFIDNCTTNLLNDFRSVYGDNDVLTVNTVVVSGRTVEINAIRNKIREFFGDNVSYCRIDGRDFDGNNNNNNNNNNRTLKTVVAEGALAYMDYEQNKTEISPIYGHYGIICIDPNGNKFIHGATGENPNLQNGILAGFYKNNDFIGMDPNGNIVVSREINLANKDYSIQLYHSYYNIETIVNDINGSYDKISILHDSRRLPAGVYTITLIIHPDHTLQYNTTFGNAVLQIPDDLQSDILRKSLWPCYVN